MNEVQSKLSLDRYLFQLVFLFLSLRPMWLVAMCTVMAEWWQSTLGTHSHQGGMCWMMIRYTKLLAIVCNNCSR